MFRGVRCSLRKFADAMTQRVSTVNGASSGSIRARCSEGSPGGSCEQTPRLGEGELPHDVRLFYDLLRPGCLGNHPRLCTQGERRDGSALAVEARLYRSHADRDLAVGIGLAALA